MLKFIIFIFRFFCLTSAASWNLWGWRRRWNCERHSRLSCTISIYWRIFFSISGGKRRRGGTYAYTKHNYYSTKYRRRKSNNVFVLILWTYEEQAVPEVKLRKSAPQTHIVFNIFFFFFFFFTHTLNAYTHTHTHTPKNHTLFFCQAQIYFLVLHLTMAYRKAPSARRLRHTPLDRQIQHDPGILSKKSLPLEGVMVDNEEDEEEEVNFGLFFIFRTEFSTELGPVALTIFFPSSLFPPCKTKDPAFKL